MKIKEQKLYESAQFEPGKLYRYVDNDLDGSHLNKLFLCIRDLSGVSYGLVDIETGDLFYEHGLTFNPSDVNFGFSFEPVSGEITLEV